MKAAHQFILLRLCKLFCALTVITLKQRNVNGGRHLHIRRFFCLFFFSSFEPPPPSPLSYHPTELLYLDQMATCLSFTVDQTHPGTLYTMTPLWVVKETGITTTWHPQWETPEVVTMETTLVVPPFCKCALLLEVVSLFLCRALSEFRWNIQKSNLLSQNFVYCRNEFVLSLQSDDTLTFICCRSVIQVKFVFLFFFVCLIDKMVLSLMKGNWCSAVSLFGFQKDLAFWFFFFVC